MDLEVTPVRILQYLNYYATEAQTKPSKFMSMVNGSEGWPWVIAHHVLSRAWKSICAHYQPNNFREPMRTFLVALWSTNVLRITPVEQVSRCSVLRDRHATHVLLLAGMPQPPSDPKRARLRIQMPELRHLRVCVDLARLAHAFNCVKSFPIRVRILYNRREPTPTWIAQLGAIARTFYRSVRILLFAAKCFTKQPHPHAE